MKKPYAIFIIVAVVLGFLSSFIRSGVAAPTEWEANLTYNYAEVIYGDYWYAQTFTVGSTAHTITSVKLLLSLNEIAVANVTVSVQITTISQLPNGTDLSNGQVNATTLAAFPLWIEITLSEVTLNANSEYALVVRYPNGTDTDYVNWWAATSNPYANGIQCLSINGGVTWTPNVLNDMTFQVWGNIITTYPYTYHLIGAVNETTGIQDSSITVTVYPESGIPYNITLNGDYYLNETQKPNYLRYWLPNNMSRYYTPLNDSETVYVFKPESPFTTYYVDLIDMLGIKNGYVASYVMVNGSSYVAELKKYTVGNTIPFVLMFGQGYGFRLYCDQGVYDFGIVQPGDNSLPFTFTVSSLNFPDTFLTYETFTVSASRMNDTWIQVLFADESNVSNSLTVTIYRETIDTDNIVYTTTDTVNGSYSLDWYDAQPTVGYFVNITTVNAFYGTVMWQLPCSALFDISAALDLSFLGVFPFSGAQVVGFGIALVVFGSFSYKNRYVGLLLTILVVLVETLLGMLTVPYGLIVTVACLAIMYAFTNRRP